MGIERTNQGGGKYSVPTIEVIEIATEKGFSASNPDGPVDKASYDNSFLDSTNEYYE